MSTTPSSMWIIGREWNFQRDGRRNSKHLDRLKIEVRQSPITAEPLLDNAQNSKAVTMHKKRTYVHQIFFYRKKALTMEADCN